MKTCIYFLFFVGPLIASAQSKRKDDLLLKADSLKIALSRAASITPGKPETGDAGSVKLTNFNINDTIAGLLVRILSSPRIVNYDPEILLSHDFLQIKHSKDKRLWIFGWNENTGGSFRSYLNVVHYKTASNEPRALFNTYGNGEWFSLGGTVDSIYLLPKSDKNIYLATQSVKGCETCCTKGAAVIELTDNNINFNYPAFNKKSKPLFTLTSRCGNISVFNFDLKTSTISYVYQTDDQTPISPKNAKIVNGKQSWNGKVFVEKVKKN